MFHYILGQNVSDGASVRRVRHHRDTRPHRHPRPGRAHQLQRMGAQLLALQGMTHVRKTVHQFYQ